MPLYEYRHCGRGWMAILPVEKRDEVLCTCGDIAKREISIPAKAKCIAYPEYNESLGEVVKDISHKRKILKEKGLAEV